MSLKRIDFSLRSLIRHAVPYWVCTILFFFTAAAIIFFYLRHHEQQKADFLLNHYQSIYRQSGPSALQRSFPSSGTDDGSFLRLEGAALQLILVSNPRNNDINNLPDFTSFSTEKNLVWHRLQAGKHWGSWTVAANILPNGNTLQVGIYSKDGLKLFYGLIRWLFSATLFFLLLCFFPARSSARQADKTIRQLKNQINSLNRGERHEIRNSRPDSLEEQQLIKAIGTLLDRHQQLTRELQESMDNVAHDLRTPMTRLRAIAEYGLQKSDDKMHLQEALADCLEESDKLLSMLNAMLNVAEAEADTIQLNLESVDLEDCINEVLDLYSIIAEEKNVTLNFTPKAGIGILADRGRITQVWANLVDNAIKYNATEINISTQRVGNTAKIIIHDNGMGISPNEIPKIWDRLYRGDRSRSKPGLGLGLTLVRATVNNHNGTIEVRSTLNRETIFTVELPIAT